MVLICSVLFKESFTSLYSLCVYKTVFLEDFCAPGCYAACADSCLPTFRDCLSVPSRRVRAA